MDEKILKELKEQTKWLKEQAKWSKEQAKWLNFLSLSELKRVIDENLNTEKQKRIYSFTNGENSTYDIKKKLKLEGIEVSHGTIYNYWKRWNVLGIVRPKEMYSGGRFEKIIELEDLGIK